MKNKMTNTTPQTSQLTMKRAAVTKALRSNTKAVSVFLCIVAMLTCVSLTFAWFGSTFENLNTVIAMGDYSANITVYDTDGNLIKNMSASNGEKVSFDNTQKLGGWSSGAVSAYYICAENTGDIDIKTYFSFKSSFTSKSGNDINSNKKHFSFFIKNITQNVKSDRIGDYINNNNTLPTAKVIREKGKTFAEANSSIAGRVNAGEKEIFALYFCCYDLPDEYVNSKYNFILNTSIVTTQAGTPEDEAAVTQPQTEAIADPTTGISDSKQNTATEVADKTQSTTNSTDAVQSSTQPTTKKVEKVTDATKPATKDEWVWKYNGSDKKTVTITEYNGKADKVVIPSLANGAVVTSLGDNIFVNSKVKSVTVPATVTSFKVNTFTCKTLSSLIIQSTTNVSDKIYTSPFICKNGVIYTSDMRSLVRYMPNNVEKEFIVPADVNSIYDNAFQGCSNLETISVKNVSSFNSNTLNGSSIKNVNLYNDNVVNAAGFNVFGDASKVTVHIPSGMEEKYAAATSVVGYEVKLDLTENIYEKYSTVECNGLKYSILNSGDEYKGTKYQPEGYSEFVILTDYISIPESGVVIVPEAVVCDGKVYTVAAVADGAFKGCTELKTIVLPNRSVTYSSNAFEGCDNLGLIQYNDVLPYTPGIKETAALNDPESKDKDSSEDSE